VPANAEIEAREEPPGDRRYFCVVIPEGVLSILFELGALTSDLNLYVGHPDIETVQDGGVWFWYSEETGAQDENVLVEAGPSGTVNAGPYYIEVVAEDFRNSSPFTLTVRLP
jgi:hypothetical protein